MTSPHRLRVAYLAGTSHCGSTLMALLMDSHPQIASVGETSFTRRQIRGETSQPPCSCGESVPDCDFWQRLFRAVNIQGFELSASNWTNDYRYENSLVNKLLAVYHSQTPKKQLHRLVASLLPMHRARLRQIDAVNAAYIQSVLQIRSADVFFDTSKNLMRLYHLLKIPTLDVQIVRIIRDARAFAHSYRKRSGGTVATAAKQWDDYQRGISDLVQWAPPEKVLSIKYEDLCMEPQTFQKHLYRFLAVSVITPPDRVDPKEHHVLGNPMRMKGTMTIRPDETWRQTLTREDLLVIGRIAGRTNQSYGYGE